MSACAVTGRGARGCGDADRVAGVVNVGPRVGALGDGAVGEAVEDALVRVVLAAEEDEVLERVRAPVVVQRLRRQHKVALHDRACKDDACGAEVGASG